MLYSSARVIACSFFAPWHSFTSWPLQCYPATRPNYMKHPPHAPLSCHFPTLLHYHTSMPCQLHLWVTAPLSHCTELLPLQGHFKTLLPHCHTRRIASPYSHCTSVTMSVCSVTLMPCFPQPCLTAVLPKLRHSGNISLAAFCYNGMVLSDQHSPLLISHQK